MATDTRAKIALVRKIQGAAFGSGDFVAVTGMKDTTWRQQKLNGGTAVACGLRDSAVPGVYGPLDVCFRGAVNFMAFYTKIEMGIIAEKVREEKIWKELTKSFAVSERDLFEQPGVLRVPEVPRSEQQFFALAWTSKNPPTTLAPVADKKQVWAGVGKMQAASDQVDGTDRAIFMLDLQRVVRMAYEMAEKAGVLFPPRLCPDPDDAEGWGKWENEIDDYLVATGIKRRKRKVTA